MTLRSQLPHLNPYDLHKALVNVYLLQKPGDTKLLQRDSSKDKHDLDVIKEHHRFLWDTDVPDSWEARLARKYYDKLFKEYCIGDLSRYKDNKVALRWRTEQEVVDGKGQFTCGHKPCTIKEGLKTWELNFAYIEQGEKKNALVKIRLCIECSAKLNYHSKKREVKRLHHKNTERKCKSKGDAQDEMPSVSSTTSNISETTVDVETKSDTNVIELPWENHKPVEMKSRDEEMEEYLQELLL